MENKLLEIYSDGAARGNPGEASWAYVFSVDGTIMEKYSGYIGISTNNIAEYLAVINSLIAASRSGYQLVRLFSDSELVIRQINGEYRVRKEHLIPLREKVERIRKNFKDITFHSVPRSNPTISLADRMCNEILDTISGS
jgi:ribonuclease HI